MWWRCPLSFLSGLVCIQPSQNITGALNARVTTTNTSREMGLANTSCLPTSVSHSILALLLTDRLLRLHFLNHPRSQKHFFSSLNFRRISCSECVKFDIKILKVLKILHLFIFMCSIYVYTCLCVYMYVSGCVCVCQVSSSITLPFVFLDRVFHAPGAY